MERPAPPDPVDPGDPANPGDPADPVGPVNPAARARAEQVWRHLRGLYGMVDLPAPGAVTLADLVARADRLCAQLLDGGARVVQLRIKQADARALLAAAAPIQSRCRTAGALFTVNDRLDVALVLGADVVHLGQDDLPLAAARSIAPPGMIIGISTHNQQQARAALDGGADYIGFGPVFPTRSKDKPDPVVGTAELAAICHLAQIPVVAIGGIDLENLAQVAAAGASCAALISAVNHAPDVTIAARRARALLLGS